MKVKFKKVDDFYEVWIGAVFFGTVFQPVGRRGWEYDDRYGYQAHPSRIAATKELISNCFGGIQNLFWYLPRKWVVNFHYVPPYEDHVPMMYIPQQRTGGIQAFTKDQAIQEFYNRFCSGNITPSWYRIDSVYPR
jgi:hypothetical protein